MKQILARLGIAVVVLSALAPMGSAQEPTMPRSQRSFDKLDGDHNGVLTYKELQPKAEQRLMRVDANKDGQVSAAEIDAMLQKAMEKRRDRILKALDADANGMISKEEINRYVEALVKAADTDGNGGVSLDEARKFKLAKLRKLSTGGEGN